MAHLNLIKEIKKGYDTHQEYLIEMNKNIRAKLKWR